MRIEFTTTALETFSGVFLNAVLARWGRRKHELTLRVDQGDRILAVPMREILSIKPIEL